MPLATRPHCLELGEATATPLLACGDYVTLSKSTPFSGSLRGKPSNFFSKLEHLGVKWALNTLGQPVETRTFHGKSGCDATTHQLDWGQC